MEDPADPLYRPQLTQAGLAPTHAVEAVDEHGERREVHVAGEAPLTLYVDGREIVTLMTLGTHPEALALGYLRTQRFVNAVEEIRSVEVSWETESVRVSTWNGVEGWDEKLKKRTVTSHCTVMFALRPTEPRRSEKAKKRGDRGSVRSAAGESGEKMSAAISCQPT